MPAPDLRHAFPHAIPLPQYGTLQDERFDPGCGFVNQQEAAVLYRLACDFPGTWVEVGSHTGWSAAHIASAPNVHVHAVEPQFADREFYARAIGNWQRAGVLERVTVWPLVSEKALYAIPGPFDGAFVDGNHDAPHPLLDAHLLLPKMADRCVIAFHDYVGQPTRHAVSFLEGEGFRVTIVESLQGLAVCWRGDWNGQA